MHSNGTLEQSMTYDDPDYPIDADMLAPYDEWATLSPEDLDDFDAYPIDLLPVLVAA